MRGLPIVPVIFPTPPTVCVSGLSETHCNAPGTQAGLLALKLLTLSCAAEFRGASKFGWLKMLNASNSYCSETRSPTLKFFVKETSNLVWNGARKVFRPKLANPVSKLSHLCTPLTTTQAGVPFTPGANPVGAASWVTLITGFNG